MHFQLRIGSVPSLKSVFDGSSFKIFDTFVPELIENNVKVNVMGYTDQLPEKTQKAVFDAIEQTKTARE